MKKLLLFFLWSSMLLAVGSVQAQIGFPYCETFTTPNTQSETIFGGNAQLIQGVLRLTSNQTDQKGFVYINVPFSSSYGIKVEFEYFSYGGTGLFLADGISMFLFDAETKNFNVGGFGGSLGYAQKDNLPGLSNAYLGVGFDEFGNFGVSNEGKSGGFPNLNVDNRAPDAIVLRGPGNGLNGYPFVVGRKVNTTSADNDGLGTVAQFPISSGGSGTSRVTDPNQVGYRKVFLELEPDPDGVGYFLTLQMQVTTVANQPRMVTIFDRPFDFAAPKNLKIGFAGSTGGYSNFHEIRNLIVEVSNDEALKNPLGIDLQDYSSCAGQENQFAIKDEDVTLPNENSSIRCLQFFKTKEDIVKNDQDVCNQARCLEENRFLILPEGVFQASDNAGGFTFTPNEEYIGKQVTVYYTITDSYGKTSDGNSITLDINESPEPIRIYVPGQTETQYKIELCAGESVVLEGKGEEVYSRYEWYKDGEQLEGQIAKTLTASKDGYYEVWGYNLKGCPAVSESFWVDFPDTPEVSFEEVLVSCDPDVPVDVLSYIPDLDLENFDYLLSGPGGDFLNEQMKQVFDSGMYELKMKPKGLDCYSEGVEVEIFVQANLLISDFDFMVQGTEIRDDASGGIFPDDILEFSEKADDRAVKWTWDFGDGQSSSDKNPTHVFGKKGVFQVQLTIEDEWGCTMTKVKEVAITKSYRLMFPTGFTPTEAENLTFIPKWKGLVEVELLIFNLWGELIYRGDSLEMEGWDGTLNGKPLEPGLFVYRFNGVATDGEKVAESGKFKLIR